MSKYSQISKQDQNFDIIGSLTSKQCYFLVFPFSKQQAQMNLNYKYQVPSVFVYNNTDQTTVKQLVESYNLQFNQKAYTFQFARNGAGCLKLQDTIKQIKRKLRKENIDGEKLYIVSSKEYLSNECSILEVQSNKEKLNMAKVRIHFWIKHLNYSIYLYVQANEQIKSIKERLTLQVRRIWGKNITSSMIQIINELNIKTVLPSERIEFNVNGFVLPMPNENKCYLVVKSIGGLEIQNKVLQYQAISSKRVVDLLSEIDLSKQKKVQWNTYGMRIGQIILKSNDIISQRCRGLFKKSQTQIKHLVGVILKEAHLFQAEKSKIAGKDKFDLEAIVVSTQSNNLMKKKCEKEIMVRANQASHQYFKDNFKNVEPILLYTAQLKVFSSNKAKQSSIFRILNQFLRNQNFAETTEQDYNKWEYVFQCILLSKLSLLPPLTLDPQVKSNQILPAGWTNKILWRGQGYQHQFGQKQVIHFKQFLSTTEQENIAKGFATGCIYKIVKSKSGRSIKDYSIFKESEVLFPSYSSFRVLNKASLINEKKNNKKITCYELEEVEIEPLPLNQINFILWVDDKTAEGKRTWQELNYVENSTVLQQFISTQELQKWLTVNDQALKSSTQVVNVALISNMTRIEKEKENGFAGVQAIKVFRRFWATGNILLYIYDKKVAVQKLAKHGLAPNKHLKVSNEKQQLRIFLKENIKII